MIRIITTAVIECDQPGCEDKFFDPVDATAAAVADLATVGHGWFEFEFIDGMPSKFFCPGCLAKHGKIDDLTGEITTV